jgi:uncharacterized phage protein (TIGR02218 family)
MTRNITPTIRAATNAPASTLTRLLRIICQDGSSYGLCMSNRDITYDHGDGEVFYSATNSFDPSMFSSDITYSVDNAQSYALISNDIAGITEQDIHVGKLDGAQWVCYYVDYKRPYVGTAVVLDAGDVGIVQVQFGMLWTPELLSYVIRLKQNIGDVYSRTCRADYGSSAPQPHGCGVDITSLWQSFTVAALGAETDRVFVVHGLTVDASRPFYPGVVEWTHGQNAGKVVSVEGFADGANQIISLMEPMPYAIAPGDGGFIRPDCDKTWARCGVDNNQINFKGEPLIPVGDTAAIQVPGAQT